MFFLLNWLAKNWHLTVALASISVMPLSELDIFPCPILKYCCHLNVGDRLITVFAPPLCQLIVPFNHISAVLIAVPHQCIACVNCSGNCQRSVLLLSRVGSYDLISSLIF